MKKRIKVATKPKVTTNLFDHEELHHNCTVQVLSNSVTGEVSIGWWHEDNPPAEIGGREQ